MPSADTLFLAALVSLPVQLGKFFFLDESYVLGIPIDYRAVTLYFSDLVILAYLVVFMMTNAKILLKIYHLRKNFIIVLAIFSLYLFITSLFVSSTKIVSTAASFKFLEFTIFALFASISLQKSQVFQRSLNFVALSLVWQSVIIIGQFIFQKSLGLTILGERTFDSSTVGIAHAQIFGREFLRPYGTFPHPNVAAAFLIIYLVIYLMLSGNHRNLPKILIATFALIAIFLTFSKAAYLALAILAIVKATSFGDLLKRAIVVALLFLIAFRFVAEPQIASFAERLILSQAALDISLKSPLFGVGPGNFIAVLAGLNLFSLAETRLLQPVHNIFLLILAENGLVGLFLFGTAIAAVTKNVSTKTFALFIIILIFASVDHFFWTLQQGQFLFWLAISFILAQNHQVKEYSDNAIVPAPKEV